MKISVVIPSYNGWDRLGKLCVEIKKSLLITLTLEDFEIIIVDDCSKNRSDKQIIELRNMGIDVKGLFLKRNYGQQFATLAGITISKGDYILTVDDDLSHKPEDFFKLISKIKNENLDVVYGIPQNSRQKPFRKYGSGLRDIIFNIFFSKPKDISVSSFRILSRSLIKKITGDISEYRYLSVEIIKQTKLIGNIQVEFNRDIDKNSRYSLIKLIVLAFSLIRCSGLFPKRIRISETASKMEWDLI